MRSPGEGRVFDLAILFKLFNRAENIAGGNDAIVEAQGPVSIGRWDKEDERGLRMAAQTNRKSIRNRKKSARPAGPRLRLHIGETQSCPIFERPYKPAIPCARSIFLKVHLEKRCPAPSTVTELEQYLMRARIEIEASGRLWNQSIQRSQSFRRFRNSASATACCCRFIDGRGNGSDCSSGGGGQRSDRPDRIRAGSAMRPG